MAESEEVFSSVSKTAIGFVEQFAHSDIFQGLEHALGGDKGIEALADRMRNISRYINAIPIPSITNMLGFVEPASMAVATGLDLLAKVTSVADGDPAARAGAEHSLAFGAASVVLGAIKSFIPFIGTVDVMLDHEHPMSEKMANAFADSMVPGAPKTVSTPSAPLPTPSASSTATAPAVAAPAGR